MHKITHFIGIDVSKKTLDFTLFVNGKKVEHWRIDNTKGAIKKLLTLLKKKYQVVVGQSIFILEYTGIYNEIVVPFLTEQKHFICVEAGVHVKRSLGLTRGKNDKVDSFRLAEYGYAFRHKIKLFQPKKDIVKKLSVLISFRDRLLKTKKQHQTPINELVQYVDSEELNEAVVKPAKRLIQQTKLQIKNLEKQINQLIASDEELKRVYTIATSVKGVGMVTAVRIIIATNLFTVITEPKKFACHSGVAPFEHTSGTSIKGKNRISHMANKKIKSTLTMGARSAIQHDPELKAYYNRMVDKGKNKRSVLNAVKNKIIHRVFACLRDNRLYQDDFVYKVA